MSSILQFFSKNFFSKIFPDRYFQKELDDESVNIYPTGLQINLGEGIVTVTVPSVTPITRPTTFQQSGGVKRQQCIVRPKGLSALSFISNVNIEAIQLWDTEEEIIELINIIFQLMDNDFTNNKDTEEEEIELIMSILGSDF